MFPRFGITYFAVEASQARMRAAHLQRQNNQVSEARAAIIFENPQ